jgi:hypothetical protein
MSFLIPLGPRTTSNPCSRRGVDAEGITRTMPATAGIALQSIHDPYRGGPVKDDDPAIGGTWRDDSPVQTGPLIDIREQQRHIHVLQSRLLTGLGAIFMITLLMIIVGPAVGAISEDYARSLAQMVIPALLTFGGTIVGTLFSTRK